MAAAWPGGDQSGGGTNALFRSVGRDGVDVTTGAGSATGAATAAVIIGGGTGDAASAMRGGTAFAAAAWPGGTQSGGGTNALFGSADRDGSGVIAWAGSVTGAGAATAAVVTGAGAGGTASATGRGTT